jgi:hypothetical protein
VKLGQASIPSQQKCSPGSRCPRLWSSICSPEGFQVLGTTGSPPGEKSRIREGCFIQHGDLQSLAPPQNSAKSQALKQSPFFPLISPKKRDYIQLSSPE